MTLTKYYQKSRFRRALCHFIPFVLATCVGALAIMAMDRNIPVTVVWGKVIPPEVLVGQPITFHYGSIRHHDYGGTIKRWIVDVHGQVFNLSDTGVFGNDLPIDQEGEVVKNFVVPCGMAVGDATYHSDVALYAKWNFMQRLFPVHQGLEYPFTVKSGAYGNACAVAGSTQGIQGIQGIQGAPGVAAPLIARPRIINKVWIEPTTLTAGGEFIVHVDVTINQVCPAETHWSLVRKSDGVEVLKIIQPSTPTKLGPNNFQSTRMLPAGVPPGEYYYVATIYEFCGPDRTTFMATTEHIPLTVK